MAHGSGRIAFLGQVAQSALHAVDMLGKMLDGVERSLDGKSYERPEGFDAFMAGLQAGAAADVGYRPVVIPEGARANGAGVRPGGNESSTSRLLRDMDRTTKTEVEALCEDPGPHADPGDVIYQLRRSPVLQLELRLPLS